MRLQNLSVVVALFFVVVANSAGAPIPETGEKLKCIVPIRAITSGKAHWFGYYDKEAFDPTDRYVLAAEVAFEDRSPTAHDAIKLGMVDTKNGDTWIPLGESTAWGWQQGCMLQWVPGTDSTILYNTREYGKHIAVLKDVVTGDARKLPRAIYTISPDGKTGLSINFARLQDCRPGYGYQGGTDPGAEELAPEGDGIWRVDMATGESKLLFSYADMAAVPWGNTPKGKYWFNHLLFNPDGTRFVFLNRAHVTLGVKKPWATRMFTASVEGGGLHVVADYDMVSHFIWRDPAHLLAWSSEPDTGNKYHLYTDQSDQVEVVGAEVFSRDGHCTYSPDRQWILTDTYPDKNSMHQLMLYNIEERSLRVPYSRSMYPPFQPA